MKPASLLLLRLGTGLLLVIWGLMKIMSPESAIGVSEKYYAGTVSAEMLQLPWGLLQVTVGTLVVLGLFRKIIYPLQAVMLVLGAVVIWRYLLDPFGLYLFGEEGGNILFFPSLCVAAATLVLIAVKEFDTWSLDVRLRPRGTAPAAA